MKRWIALLLACMTLSASARAQESVPVGVVPRGSLAVPDAPSPRQLAIAELHRIQLREPELWRKREEGCVGCGVAGVVIGVPVATIMIPFGGLILAFADDGYDDYYDEGTDWERRDRIVGSVLLLLGSAGLAYAVYGIHKLVKDVRTRRSTMQELRSLADQRTIWERTLEAELAR